MRTCRLCHRNPATTGSEFCADCRIELRVAAVAAAKRNPRMPARHLAALLEFVVSSIRGAR